MNIWVVQIGEAFPLNTGHRKMRTAVTVEKLLECGHNVTWWTSGFDHFDKKWFVERSCVIKISDKYRIVAIKGFGYKKNVSLSRFIDHRIIAFKWSRMAPEFPVPDLILCAMPSHDLAYQVISYGKKNQIKTILDIRDPWPEVFVEQTPKILRSIIRTFLFHEYNLLKYSVKNASVLVAVTKTFLDWATKIAGRRKINYDRVYYLGSEATADDKGEHDFFGVKEDWVTKCSGKFVVCFIGTFARYHDPEILCKCAARAQKNNMEMIFLICGSGEKFAEYQSRYADLSNLILTGWLDANQIQGILKLSSIGVCPTTFDVDLFPNKAFTYFSAGLPVVSAFSGDLKDVIERRNLGFNYKLGDLEDLWTKILQLYGNEDLRREMAMNVRELFESQFDSQRIYSNYVDFIEQIFRTDQIFEIS
ncbi:MAG: hypothetical protein CVV64_11330 [Candidatus Wallbacteria bacterium HGW-Wallbacteria-1]|jgi:glycosyltransferase involved in cell wall biosynthesis|uniref:Glycosyl transferase family 1 domain-containing protein n=1 Tax=Candidatus Wallbacteria bacterium HGW-Wallbacteria-1 TaxID=2013854 RepID=A0A2N1PP99_9BACT|nr:MAG: hypothetical protein CVV64_11330 [Candidatus Wallbacteria bacterium HGW-Wallbacteria-1]